MLLIILSGSAAFAQAFPHAEYLAALTALLGALELVYGFSHKARDHELLHRRFTELLADIKTHPVPDESMLGDWSRKRLLIETDEPPIYWALEASCDNEVRIAWGCEKLGLVKLSWWQKLMMNWQTFHKSEFKFVPLDTAARAFEAT